jgi:hypothetical protein
MMLDVEADAGASKRARLLRFYRSMGFQPLPGQPDRLFISLRGLPAPQ